MLLDVGEGDWLALFSLLLVTLRYDGLFRSTSDTAAAAAAPVKTH